MSASLTLDVPHDHFSNQTHSARAAPWPMPGAVNGTAGACDVGVTAPERDTTIPPMTSASTPAIIQISRARGSFRPNTGIL